MHRGAAQAGHYWSYIRPGVASESNDAWVKFDDTTVSRVDSVDEMLENAYGNGRSSANAYILFYVRLKDAAKLFP